MAPASEFEEAQYTCAPQFHMNNYARGQVYAVFT